MSHQSMTVKHELCGYGPVHELVPINRKLEDQVKYSHEKKKKNSKIKS